jgi:hypothetical protein
MYFQMHVLVQPVQLSALFGLQDALAKYEERAEAQAAVTGKRLLFIILDLSPVTDVDASSVHYLKVGEECVWNVPLRLMLLP